MCARDGWCVFVCCWDFGCGFLWCVCVGTCVYTCLKGGSDRVFLGESVDIFLFFSLFFKIIFMIYLCNTLFTVVVFSPKPFPVVQSASGELALSRSVELSRWFHFIAQNKTMGSPHHFPIHTHRVWKYHKKGNITGKKKEEWKINRKTAKHTVLTLTRPQDHSKRIAVGAFFCTYEPSDRWYLPF